MNYDEYLKSDRSGKGYKKESVLSYMDSLFAEVTTLEETLRSLNPNDPYFAESQKNDNTILKSTSSGGFVKDDVCKYLDSTYQKIDRLISAIKYCDSSFTYSPAEHEKISDKEKQGSHHGLGEIISGIFKKK